MFFSSSPGSSALISYAVFCLKTSTAGIVRNAASVRRKGMGSNNDLPKKPPVKSSKRRSISRRKRSNGSHCCGSREEDVSDRTGTLLAGSAMVDVLRKVHAVGQPLCKMVV